MTRYPALVMALSWSAALTTALVMFPEQPAVGAVAIGALSAVTELSQAANRFPVLLEVQAVG